MTTQLTTNEFSQSEITTLDACGRKWFWQYGQRLKRIGMWNWNFVVGNELHTFLENFYKKSLLPTHSVFNPKVGEDVLRTADFLSKREFWEIVFPAYCTVYKQLYPSEPFEIAPDGVEVLACREYRGINFKGKIDLRGTHKKNAFISDHKSTGKLEVLGDQLHQRFQFPFYFWLSGIEEGEFMVNRIKKPAQRQGKKETTREFAQRVAHEILDSPIDYFAREWTYFSKEEMVKFQTEILDPKVNQLLRILDGKHEDSFIWTNKVGGNCYTYNSPCPFLSLCYDDEALASVEYEQKTSKHEELEVEE